MVDKLYVSRAFYSARKRRQTSPQNDSLRLCEKTTEVGRDHMLPLIERIAAWKTVTVNEYKEIGDGIDDE